MYVCMYVCMLRRNSLESPLFQYKIPGGFKGGINVRSVRVPFGRPFVASFCSQSTPFYRGGPRYFSWNASCFGNVLSLFARFAKSVENPAKSQWFDVAFSTRVRKSFRLWKRSKNRESALGPLGQKRRNGAVDEYGPRDARAASRCVQGPRTMQTQAFWCAPL